MCVFDVYPCLASISLETGNFLRQRETGLRFSVVDPSLLGSKISEGGKRERESRRAELGAREVQT